MVFSVVDCTDFSISFFNVTSVDYSFVSHGYAARVERLHIWTFERPLGL